MDQVATRDDAARERRPDAVGPFIEPAALLLGYGCPRELLRRMTTARVLLALPTRGGSLAYPAFQFDADGEPLPGLPLVLDALDPAGSSGWRDAVWLTTPNPSLDGATPTDALRAGRLDEVRAAAAGYDFAAVDAR